MERDNLNLISKKQRIDSTITEDNPNLTGEGSSKVVDSTCAKRENIGYMIYRLYFKGLVSDETTTNREQMVKAGLGVAICYETDTLLYETKESMNSSIINREEVEIIALITGLNEAIHLGIRNIVICCDDHQIYQIIIGKERPMQNIARLVEEVQRLRGKLNTTEVVLVGQDDVNFAFTLAVEAILSQSSVDVNAKAPQGETCSICIEETDAERMFIIDKCFHRYCFFCVKKHVEVKLLSGVAPTCLDYGCKSELTLETCFNLLRPKVVEMWKQKMAEDLIPAAEKIYCPYPSCSMLMSKTALSSEANQSNVRACVKCCGLFCIDCKVPSHSDLSCADYKKLNPEPLVDDMKLKALADDNMWRQCVQCRHLIERFEGCNHMTCRCGYEFCYICGMEWNKNQRACPSGCLSGDDDEDDEDYDFDEDDDDDDDEYDDEDDEDDEDYDFDEDDDDDDDEYDDDDDEDDEDYDFDEDDDDDEDDEAELDGIDIEDVAVDQP